MRLIQSLPVLVLLALAPAWAVPCQISATSAPLLSGGLAEPLATMTLACSGASAAALLQGYLFVTVQGTVTNHQDANKNVLGLTVANNNTGTPVPLAGLTVTQTATGLTITGISTNFDALGRLTLLVSGVRSAAAAQVMARLDFIALPAPPALDIPAGLVEVGHAVDAVLTATPDAAFQPISGGVTGVNLAPTIASMVPNLNVRVSEAAASAFHPKLAADDTGTRIRLRFAELPAGSRIFAPDAVAGYAPRRRRAPD